MNGYDANALEAAIQLKEAHGGRITAVCLGDDTSRNTLKRALAMGADAAVLLNDPAWLNLDSAGTAHVLAAAIRKSGAFDLVLCGRQASDTDGGQVLYWLAEALGLPAVGPVSKIEAVEEWRAHRAAADGGRLSARARGAACAARHLERDQRAAHAVAQGHDGRGARAHLGMESRRPLAACRASRRSSCGGSSSRCGPRAPS